MTGCFQPCIQRQSFAVAAEKGEKVVGTFASAAVAAAGSCQELSLGYMIQRISLDCKFLTVLDDEPWCYCAVSSV